VADVTETADPAGFDDLLAANRAFASSFSLSGFDGVARAGVAMVTCMDSRIHPLGMLGLAPGDMKVLRNPGGRVNDDTLVALVLSVHLLNVKRILVVEHTRCAMASATEQEFRDKLTKASGVDASWMSIDVITDREATVRDDVSKVRAHPLIGSSVTVGGFVYDVDTGLLQPVV
jgi:carbonic anhydrase